MCSRSLAATPLRRCGAAVRMNLMSPCCAANSFRAPQPSNSPSHHALQKVIPGWRNCSRFNACLLSGGEFSAMFSKCSRKSSAISGPDKSSIFMSMKNFAPLRIHTTANVRLRSKRLPIRRRRLLTGNRLDPIRCYRAPEADSQFFHSVESHELRQSDCRYQQCELRQDHADARLGRRNLHWHNRRSGRRSTIDPAFATSAVLKIFTLQRCTFVDSAIPHSICWWILNFFILGGDTMRYMMFIKHTEDYRMEEVPQSLFDAMGEFVGEAMKNGSMIDTAGLQPTAKGKRVRLKGGKLSVIDGPFAETKEVIGGYALVEAKSNDEALALATRFMDLHRIHWPAFEGECEVRPLENMEPPK